MAYKSAVTCQIELDHAVTMYNVGVIASLAWTLFVVLVYALCLKNRLEGAPGLGAQFYGVTGSLKVLMALALFTILQPGCPKDCSCVTSSNSYVYPCFALLVGLTWWYRGWKRWQLARYVTQQSDGMGDDAEAVFDKVPTVELA